MPADSALFELSGRLTEALREHGWPEVRRDA
jgi:hypothetical protein